MKYREHVMERLQIQQDKTIVERFLMGSEKCFSKTRVNGGVLLGGYGGEMLRDEDFLSDDFFNW